ncbi:TolC family outer membrane protein [Acinetobacter nosocomialis]|uniref:multidrug efflux outer membrane protein AbuO n=1 Tax=Acinetobacter nosocomialis TaxID=106654 RepID=UPI00280EBFD1|nr:TolC family outer membrane protein [Acinetobacter nosocomialis]MDQ9030962.1 TolC family outer membrane protein [Acinetobacter nosocomialis]MDQ9048236.1 TolC family outer membrane protein [Acinetobacter nosocomialis]MDQ9085697.1 TolC family outer membrane protein [Acinetobacter nosocomialis]
MLVASLWSFASPSFALDLVETYERAKQNDPTWQANQQQFEADQLNLGLATGALLPTVTLSGKINRNSQTVKRSNFPGVDQEGLSDALVSNTSTTKQATLSARQPLFRMDAWEGYKQVKTSVALSEITLRLQKQDHVLNVAEAYFNVLRQQALTAAYLQEEKALLEQLNMMNAKLKEGLVARSDVSEANAQYQNARANRIATNVQLLLAQEQLSEYIGPYQDKLAVLRSDFTFQKPYPAQLDDWIGLAQQQNLKIQQARLQKRYAEDQRRVEKAALYPQIDAVASYGYTKQTPETLISTDGKFDQVGVEMNWNLFNGAQTRTSIKKATIELNKAQSQLDAAIRRANVDVKSAFMQVDTDRAKLEARKAAMDSSSLVSQASKASYNEGLKSMVDVLLAQRNAFSAKQDYLNAQYDYLLNVLRLKAAVGQLGEKDLVELNSWLTYQ